MILRLAKLQESNKEAQKLPAIAKLKKGWKNVNTLLYYQRLSFVSKIIQIELISRYHNNFLARYFSINKIKKLIN